MLTHWKRSGAFSVILCLALGACMQPTAISEPTPKAIPSTPKAAQPSSPPTLDSHDKTGPLPNPPTSIAFRDSTRGVAGGGTWLATTTDAGGRWHRVEQRFNIIEDLDVAGTNDIFVATNRRVWHSGDNGTSWDVVVTVPMLMVDFATPDVGWASDGNKTIATHDGGRTWEGRPDPCKDTLSEDTTIDLTFPSPTTGWALCAGEGGAGQAPKGLARTNDGGTTWNPVLTDEGSYGYVQATSFLADGWGYLMQSRGSQFRTHDGGRTWRRINEFESEIDFGVDVSAINPNEAFMLIDAKFTDLMKTDDGGIHWHRISRW